MKCYVQCKYWSQHKVIHEKHINQLFGTAVMYDIETGGSNHRQMDLFVGTLRSGQVGASFRTSTSLSETAKRFADALGVTVIQNRPLQPYPCIKCKVSRRTGEHIYHLPFDQQYDTTVIEEERNECYVETVGEAESLGYRRAWRWRGGSE